MTEMLVDFCKSFSKALDDQACDDLIKLFKEHPEHQDRVQRDGRPNFTQFNFTKNKELNPDLHEHLIECSHVAIDAYKKTISETEFWPKKYGFEVFRMKHYNNDGIDEFTPHVDASNTGSMRRFLAFFWYLNDVEEGGETVFFNQGIKVIPEKGKIFMFPPLWTFPHRGMAPISNEKFLLSSYLHFID